VSPRAGAAQRGEAERSRFETGIAFVVAAPSGTGKTTVCRLVVERDGRIELSVSHTTRPRRPGERDGVAYHFVSREAFQEMVEAKAFLEWAEYHGNRYGTSWAALEGPLARGRDVLLEIEVQGARQVRERLPTARLIFLVPPSFEVLEARLRARGTEPEEAVAERLRLAKLELAAADGLFHFAVVNDDLEACVANVCEILRAEREGRGRELRERFHPGRVLEALRAGALPPAGDRVP
jgi:guanylate kinase